MSTSEIEVLLGKFYEGTSSLQEEKILRDFFSGHDVPAHLKSHQPLFNYFVKEQRQESGNQDFEERLASRLSEGEAAEIAALPINSHRSRFLFIAGIAASVLLLVGLVFTFQTDIFKKSPDQTGSREAEIAYHDASQALMLVSCNLNTGIKQMEKLQMVDKAMKNVQLFNKFYQYQTIIINPDEIQNQSIKTK